MGMSDFEVRHFRDVLDRSLEQAKRFLDNEKSHALVPATGDAPHTYEDKYLLAEQVVSSAGDALLADLRAAGLTSAALDQLKQWAGKSAVSLRFEMEEDCQFLQEVSRQEEGRASVQETTTTPQGTTTTTSKVITTITEYHYNYTVSHRLLSVRGVGADASDILELSSAQGSAVAITRMKTPPVPRHGQEGGY